MCELLLRSVDSTHPDPLTDSQLLKRGMVIHLAADGWGWSRIEKTNPEWRIIRLPGVEEDAVSMLLTAQPYYIETIGQVPPVLRDPFQRPRAFAVDIDSVHLTAPMRDYLNDATRQAPWYDVPDDVQVESLIVRTSILKNPGEFG